MSTYYLKFPIIRALKDRHEGHDIEYTASAVFQAIFQTHYSVYENKVMLCEQPASNRDSRRMDQLCMGYDTSTATLVPNLIVEGKGGGGSIKDAENQAKSHAKAVCDAHRLTGIYCITYKKTKYRIWFYKREGRIFEAVDGNPNTLDDWKSYIKLGDADQKLDYTLGYLTNVFHFNQV